jgi:hypothetical protein
MTERLPRNIKCLVLSLLLLSGISATLFSQTKISGVINKYGRVTGIGTDYVIVAEETQFDQFQEGDTVLLIQMKGVRIYSDEVPASYGLAESSYGPAGSNEFLTILSVDDATNKIVFRNNIVNSTFNIQGMLQIIKVPSYNYAMVDSPGLSCQPWDSLTRTGGVLAAIIGRTLSLDGNINVTGMGFKGGIIDLGQGICATTDLIVYNKYAYHKDYNNSGYKGESSVIRGFPGPIYPAIFPGYAKGQGSNFTGGGGGNGRFSGGGGGSNYGLGGKGGREASDCTPPPPVDGGLGGKEVPTVDFPGALFAGGGGGASTYLTGSTASPGGNGGGIVIIVADTIKGNNKSIIADGAGASAASGNAGAGGGGGGGSVALYLQSFSTILSTSAITISAKGGKGGDNAANTFGEGGGGGGGQIKTSTVVLPVNVIKTVSGGGVGNRSGAETGLPGQAGKSYTDYVPTLNGFLFNSIRSSVTGNQTDSTCSNVIPKPINGTTPVGGSGDYTYLWQKKYSLAGVPADIPGSNVKDFIPSALESDTVWFRRVVRDNITSLTDTSKWVEIRVQTAIEGNLVGKDTTICYNQDPLNLVPLNSGPSKGNGKYQYQWIQNPDNSNWATAVNATGTSSLALYDPPALTATTYFKRVVTSGRCVDQSSPVTITVLPSITGNITARPDSVICEGSLFNTLNATNPGGGDLSYVYQWQESISAGIWQPAAGINANQTYIPDTLQFATIEQRYYRRTVWSGPDSVCSTSSLPILMTRYHYIENNIITEDTTICSGSVPPPLTGSTPVKGSGIYTYMWQDSSKVATWTTRGTLISPHAPPALTDTTWYRRIVNSSKCSDTSFLIVINVHKPIINNIIALKSGPGPDTTVCSGAIPNKLKGALPAGGTELPGDYAFTWYSSTDNFVSSNDPVPVSGTLQDYQPGALTSTTWFRRKTISGKCETLSNAIRVIVLPPITNNNITSDQTVCYNTSPVQLTGPVPNGGDPGLITYLWEQSADGGSTWTTASGTATEQNYSPPALTIPMKYKRTIRSGLNDCCIVTSSPASIGIHALPTAEITTLADTTICNGQTVELKIHLTGAANWTLRYNENSVEVQPPVIATSDITINRIPNGSGASLNIFNYSLAYLKDGNNCEATPALLTGTRKATVYRVPVANAGPDKTVCGANVTLEALASDGTGLWTFPPEVLYSVPGDPKTLVKIDSSATSAYKTSANVTYTFYWEETSWQCSGTDEVKITFDNRIEPLTIGENTSIYSFDKIFQVNATTLRSFETGTWSVIEGTGDFEDPNSESTEVRNISIGTNKFKWYVENGKCNSEKVQTVTVMEIVIPQGVSPNDDGFNDTFIIRGLDLRRKTDGSPAYQLAELTILNSSGKSVFTTAFSRDQDWKEWDGKDSENNDLPEGTYYYRLTITSVEVPEAAPFKRSGFIILKRY